jgi:hypothetical protein
VIPYSNTWWWVLGADQHPAAEVEDSRQEAGVRREEYQQAQPQVKIQLDTRFSILILPLKN